MLYRYPESGSIIRFFEKLSGIRYPEKRREKLTGFRILIFNAEKNAQKMFEFLKDKTTTEMITNHFNKNKTKSLQKWKIIM